MSDLQPTKFDRAHYHEVLDRVMTLAEEGECIGPLFAQALQQEMLEVHRAKLSEVMKIVKTMLPP